MSGAKSKLKEIQKHLKVEEYDEVIDLSKQVLKEEKGATQNVYHALVFAGVAYSKLERYAESEKVYNKAIDLFPELPLAYQGIQKLFTEREEWEKLGALLQGMVVRFIETDNAVETAKTLQRLIELRQQQEMTKDLLRLYDLLLPSSPIFNLLLNLDPPDTSAATTTEGASSYTPWQIPEFPAPPTIHVLPLSQPIPVSTLTFSAPPKPPTPFPAISQVIHHSDTSLALLLTLTLDQERDERDKEEKEVSIRRKRLGAGSESQVRRAVAGDILCASRMPSYYEDVLSHPATPDDIRRSTESRLLRHWYRLMTCLSRNTPDEASTEIPETNPFPKNLFDAPSDKIVVPSKESIREKIEKMTQGMILLKVEDESAWAITLEWTDNSGLDQYPLSFLHEYTLLFPGSPYTTIITGYLRYFSRPEPNDETVAVIKAKRKERRRAKKDTSKKGKKDEKIGDDAKEDDVSPEDALKTEENRRKEPFTVLINGLESLPKSIFVHKVLAEAYLTEVDYASVISTSEKGKSLIKAFDIETGLKMQSSIAYLDVLLGTALVHYYAPKHHPRALGLLDGVLKLDPEAVPCLMGRGYVFAGELRWKEARIEFEKVIELEQAKNPQVEAKDGGMETSHTAFALEALEQRGWCLIQEGDLEAGKTVLQEVAVVLDAQPARNQDSARIWWRIGMAEWQLGGDHRDQAYEAFVNSLKLFDAYAPAFTAMGIWYLEHASPPDANRASKCFQKAFELDATQAEAAKRLATGYAEEGEWALVNLVSKRVMEGEGGLEGGLSGTEGTPANKFLPTNAWAWKASGAVQMHYKQYNLAAQAFQVALRAEPEDAAVWTRLGEAYVRSGRHVASLKALYQALEFSPDSWICYYHIGGVQRELGSFALAISAYEKALDMRRDEPGTIIALSEAWLALGKSERQIGLRERAYRSTLHCLKHLTAVLGQKPYRHTNWKLFAEACLNISGCITHKEDLSEAFTAIRPTLEHMSEIDDEKTASVTEVTSVASLLRLNEFSRKDLIKTSIVVYAYRANLLKFDTKLAEVPLYDKACALHLLATVLLETEPESVQIYPCQKAAALAMKQALDIDPSSPTMWNAFAVVSAVASPQLAQHAYVTAIELQPRNPDIWCNYGFMCLECGDAELANEAFSKAQIIEPEHASAWLGQALVAYKKGDHGDAEALFEHASTLSSGNLLLSGLGYSALLFAPSVTSAFALDTSLLHQPSFALARYCDETPHDTSALLLHALILERLGLTEAAMNRVQDAAFLLEARYEKSESAETEKQYIVALVNLGRLQLSQGENENAASTMTDCIGLCSDRTDDEGIAILAQCHLVLAISLSNQESVDEALEEFQKSLGAAERLSVPSRRDICKERISVLLARTLWHFGVEDARDAAKNNLLEAFSTESHTPEAMTALASLGVLTDDEGIVEAVVAEIDELGISKTDPDGLLDYLLALIKMAKGDIEGTKRSLASVIHAKPTDTKNRLRFAKILLSLSDTSPATGLVAGLSDPKQGLSIEETAGALTIEGVAKTLEGDKTAMKTIQKAIRLEPWNQKHWQAAAMCGKQEDDRS